MKPYNPATIELSFNSVSLGICKEPIVVRSASGYSFFSPGYVTRTQFKNPLFPLIEKVFYEAKNRSAT